MPNLIILAIIAFAWYGFGLPAPFGAEIRTLVGAISPWAPLLLALYFVKDAVSDILRGVWTWISIALKALAAIVLALLFTVSVFPIMVADTFLLGDFAQFLWKYEVGPLALIALSAFAYWAVSGFQGHGIAQKYLAVMIAIGVASIGWGYLSGIWLNTARLTYWVNGGTVYVEPAASVWVKPGDRIAVSAFGRVVSTETVRDPATGLLARIEVVSPPQGDLERLIGDEERPQGELELVVHRRRQGTVTDRRVPLKKVQAGPSDIAGFDLGYYTGGYHLRGEAQIPAGAEGRLLIGFNSLQPSSGWVRMTVALNPHQSLVGRMTAQRGYQSVLGFLFIGVVIFGGAGFVTKILIPQDMGLARFAVVLAAIVLFLATVRAGVTNIAGVSPWYETAGLVGVNVPQAAKRPAPRQQQVITLQPGVWVSVGESVPGARPVTYDPVMAVGDVWVQLSDGVTRRLIGRETLVGARGFMGGAGPVVAQW